MFFWDMHRERGGRRLRERERQRQERARLIERERETKEIERERDKRDRYRERERERERERDGRCASACFEKREVATEKDNDAFPAEANTQRAPNPPEFAQPRSSRVKRRSSPARKYKCGSLFLYGRSLPRHPHDRPYRNKHTQICTPSLGTTTL